MTEDDFSLLAAGAALGALSDADQRAYLRALVEHPEWASIAHADGATVAALADLTTEVVPPAEVLDRILARIDGGSVDAVPSRRARPGSARRRWGRRGWLALAASLVVVVGIGTATVIVVQHASLPAGIAALDHIESAPDAQHASGIVQGGGPATLRWSVSVGEAVLMTGAMPELSVHHTFEIWYVRGTSAVPAGTFDSTGDSTSIVLKPGMRPGDVIAVTIESAGGSPSGQPTTKPILTIPTS